MKKSAFLVLLALAVFAVASPAAQKDIGLGGEYVFDYGSAGALNGFALTGSPPKLPIVIGLNFSFAQSLLALGVTGDWWLFQRGISGPLALYVGPGLFFSLVSATTLRISTGFRVPVGLQLFVIPPLELFVELAPKVGVAFGGGSPVALAPGISIALGARFWF